MHKTILIMSNHFVETDFTCMTECPYHSFSTLRGSKAEWANLLTYRPTTYHQLCYKQAPELSLVVISRGNTWEHCCHCYYGE